MPTYEYACTSCGHHLEAVQSFSEEPLETCPSCGGDLRKVFGSIGIVLKGSGFYRTDSRSASNGKSASKESSKETEKKGTEKKDTGSSGSGDSGGSSGSKSESAAPSSGGSTSAGTSSSGSGNAAKAAAAG